MAYAVKYLFKFQSSNGTVREIRVLKDSYTGAVIQRPLGRAPVIKKEQNGGVHGTSLTFYAECHVDREFIEFYTSDPKEYRVDVYAGSTLLWQGYITPELYSEPDIAPPYDVQVVATDGVGELKLYDFAPQGTVTLRSLFSYLLGYTGLSTDVNLVSSLKPGSHGAGALLDMQICVDYLEGKTCYEVLTYLLDTLHATITRWGGAWLLVRETNVTYTNGKVRYFNTTGNSALLSGSVQTLGSMRSAPAWPVGQLSMVIDPAKNKVAVQAPWHPLTCLANADMTSDFAWAKANNASYGPDGYLLPNNDTGTSSVWYAAHIEQSFTSAGLRVPMTFELKATGVAAQFGARVYAAVIGVLITYTVGSKVYLLRRGDEGTPVWKEGSAPGAHIDGSLVDYQQPLASFDADRIQAETLNIDEIPAFVQDTSYPSGMLTVYIVGVCARVYGAYLDVVLPKGYQDVLRIDNGARGEGDTVEIAIGRETADVAYYAAFLQGLLLDNGALITSFTDANFTDGMNYLALISRDYALSVALPRASVTGKVYLENSIGMPPLVFAKGGLNYWIETWSWDLYEDELDISARTLPSASLTVQSETILESDGSTVSSAPTAGSSGGGGSFPGGEKFFELDDTLVRLKGQYDYLGPRKGLIFGLNATADPNAHLEVLNVGTPANPVYALHSPLPLYSDAWISAGGVSPRGGTGGGTVTGIKIGSGDIISPVNGILNIPDYPTTVSLGLKALAFKDSLAVSEVVGLQSALSSKQDASTAITKSNIGDQSVAYATSAGSAPASDVYAWAKKSSLALADVPDLSSKYLPLSGGTLTGNIGWSDDSHGIYFHNGCGIEKWSLYGPALVAEGDSTDFWIRNGNDRAINHLILHAGNYTSYTVKKDGTGASGTWGISISGNAATATKLQTARTIWGRSFDGTGNVSGNIKANASILNDRAGSTLDWGNSYHGLCVTGAGISGWVAEFGDGTDNAILIGCRFGVPSIGANNNKSFSLAPNGGNVGIGTTDPQYKLDVNGTARISSPSEPSLLLRVNETGSYHYASIRASSQENSIGTIHFFPSTDNSTSAPTQYLNTVNIDCTAISFGHWTNPLMVVYTNTGAVTIGGTLTVSGQTTINNNLLATGAVTAGQASDARLKSNIVTARNACGILRGLRGVEFDWNSIATENCKDLTGHDVGLIAQEVEGLIPSAIGAIWGEYKRLDYTKITPYLVEGWKAHDEEIQRLKTKIKQLEERIYGMERKNNDNTYRNG